MEKSVVVRCGGEHLIIKLPDYVMVVDVRPNLSAVDASQAVVAALSRPIGTPPIRNAVAKGDRVVILVDDVCRPTPVSQILPFVLDHLHGAGVHKHDIAIVVGTGSHQRMGEAELAARVGGLVFERYRVASHHCSDPTAFWGVTPGGIEVSTNGVLGEASYKLGIGCVIPHGSGFTGGGKIVLPGVAGFESIRQLHSLGVRGSCEPSDPESPMRKEIDEAASLVGLHLVVDVLVDGDGGVVDAFAGSHRLEHAAATRAARASYAARVPILADVVVAGCAPLEAELYQVDFAFSQAVRICRPGGMVLTVTEPARGIGHHGLIEEDRGYREQRLRWYRELAGRYRLRLYAGCSCGGGPDWALPSCVEVLGSREAVAELVREEAGSPGSVVAQMPVAPLTIPLVPGVGTPRCVKEGG